MSLSILPLTVIFSRSAGRYEVDGYVYNTAEEPKILMTGKWNESMSYQPCDMEGEPLPNTELKEVIFVVEYRSIDPCGLFLLSKRIFCVVPYRFWSLFCRFGTWLKHPKTTNFSIHILHIRSIVSIPPLRSCWHRTPGCALIDTL